MTTAKDFAKVATQIGQIADLLRPPDSDPHAQARNLIVFHLRSAATKAREIAEAKASKEGTGL